LASNRWKSRLAATLVAAPVIAAAAFLVWGSIDRGTAPGPGAALFFDHYRNGRYEEALVEAQKTAPTDYRAFVYLAATYAELGRLTEARSAVAQMHEQWPELPDDLRRDLIERHDLAPELADQLLAGLSRAE
jgi:hypothetical protein